MGKHMREDEKKVKRPKEKKEKREKERVSYSSYNTRNKNVKTGRINPFAILLVSVILIAAIVSGILAPRIKGKIDALGGGKQGVLAMMLGHDEETKKNLDKLYLVLIGESGIDDYKLSDTIIICSYYPKTQKASLLSIPRDTYVGPNKNNASGYYKINARYRSGEQIDVLMEDLRGITGLDLQYYIRVDTKALVKLVDLIGGVDFEVPIDMKYDDPGQHLYIDLKAGMQRIDGNKAEQLLRFRHNNDGSTYSYEYGMEDFGRMHTQREFISATLKQTLKPDNLGKLKDIINIGYEDIKTNIEVDKLIDYLPYAVEFDVANLKSDRLPGISELCNGLWIYTYYRQDTKAMVEKLFLNDDVEDETATDGENADAETTSTTETANN